MITASSLPSAIGRIGELGFDGVEICLERKDWTVYPFDGETAKESREAADRAGCESRSLSFHQDYIYNDEKFAETKRLILLTRSVGARVFVFSGCRKTDSDPGEWERTVNRTRELSRVAEDSGVTLALEFEPGFVVGSTDDLFRIFGEVDSPNLCANLDLGHVFLVDRDPLQSIRSLGERIAHCHVENMAAGKHRHLLPWEGDMDLPAYIDALKEIGFAGNLAVDMYDYAYDEIADRCIKYLRELID